MSNETEVLMTGKLTKKFLMGLREGLYLVSNLFSSRFKPIYADIVAPLSERVKQWKVIIEMSVDQRLCRVFKSKEDYEIWEKQA